MAVCQPINRAIRKNLSYSDTQAQYDAAYCAASMRDFTENILVATTNDYGAIPGVTILGLRGKPGPALQEKYLPFALLIQAVLLYLPTLLWKCTGEETLRATVRYVAVSSWKIVRRGIPAHDAASIPPETSSPKRGSLERSWDELESDVYVWLSQRSLLNAYILRLIVTMVLHVIILCVYLLYTPLNIFSFKGKFVCHVDGQALVRCLVQHAFLYRLSWVANLVLVDLCLAATTFQILRLAFCSQRRRRFFFYLFLGVSDRSHSKLATDAHLISMFCYENLSIMAPGVLRSTMSTRELQNCSSLIELGSSAELSSSVKSPVYDTAPPTPQRTGEEDPHNDARTSKNATKGGEMQ